MSLSFEEIQNDLELWLSENTDYKLDKKAASKEEGRFYLKFKENHSFYLTIPQCNDGKWMVWASDEDVISLLNPVLEYTDSCQSRSLRDILKKVSSVMEIEKRYDEIDEDMDDSDDEVDDDADDYYMDEDLDALQDGATKAPESDPEEDLVDQFFTGGGDRKAVTRLIKDLKDFKKSEGKFGVVGAPRQDNLYIWDVKLTDFDPKSKLGRDLQNWAKRCNREPVVYCEMKFPKDYPMAPPFVRVVRPRFKFLTGHVTIGGSVCMEMLTRSGWVPTNDIESIMVQIRAEIMSDPNTGLDNNPDREYDEAEAKQAFERMVIRYGWNK